MLSSARVELLQFKLMMFLKEVFTINSELVSRWLGEIPVFLQLFSSCQKLLCRSSRGLYQEGQRPGELSRELHNIYDVSGVFIYFINHDKTRFNFILFKGKLIRKEIKKFCVCDPLYYDRRVKVAL